MKCCVIMVNYNNSQLTINCCESLIKNQEGSCLKLIIVDNNSVEREKELLTKFVESHEEVEVLLSSKNMGYFPALAEGMKLCYTIDEFNYIILSNNDMIYDSTFLNVLGGKKYDSNTYVVSPDIITIDGIHQNPHFIVRISKIRKLLYRIYFSGWYTASIIHFLQKRLGLVRLDKNKPGYDRAQYIYMGFGACFILTEGFINKVRMIDTRSFLMGEEALLTIQVMNAGGHIYYDPSLKVNHIDSATFKKFPSRFTYDCMKRSYKLYKDNL